MAFRRSSLGRAVIKRLPGRVKRGLRAGRRWQRRAISQLRSRWRRSLQLRVVCTTLVLSALVIAVLGFFLVQQIAAEHPAAVIMNGDVPLAEYWDGSTWQRAASTASLFGVVAEGLASRAAYADGRIVLTRPGRLLADAVTRALTE